MDSGNSGSMQSSSGDEEYDSASRPPFLNPSTHFGSLSSTNPQAHPSHLLPHHHQPTFFDPSPNLFHSFSQSTNPINPNSLLNLDLVRSRSAVRSNLPECTELGITNNHLPPSSNSSSATAASSSQSILGSSSSMQLRSVQENGIRSSSPSDQTAVVTTRNPKKRTRASRRAPTTVLTTDTSNFRAMVQEFTGIPAPPFSGSPYSRRLDLFGSVGSGLRSTQLEPMGSLYPLRPSPQKAHQQAPFLFSSSSSSPSTINVEATTTTTTSNSNNNNTVTLSIPTANPPPNILQSSVNVSGLGAKSSLSSLDDLGIDGHIGITSQGTTEGMRAMRNNYQDHLRSFDSCKLNYTAPSSDFHNHEKGLENVPSRGEGAVDSWICPSE
ncbi:hypothetical protein JCGZ_15773 [Jatropha curcas]|uniref:VQ domain-containing protein n=1 Tax=Jatropha curcas TaxID=180498 RepID=A0A067KYT9_JATCU|nr:hypothetical protein JCGZ_15773 [Jatropha curcas]